MCVAGYRDPTDIHPPILHLRPGPTARIFCGTLSLFSSYCTPLTAFAAGVLEEVSHSGSQSYHGYQHELFLAHGEDIPPAAE